MKLVIFIKIRIKFGTIKKILFLKKMNFCKMDWMLEIKKFSDLETLEKKKRREKCFCNWKLISKITIYRLLMSPRKSAGVQKTIREFKFRNNKLWKLVKLQTNKLEPLSSKSLPMRVIKNSPKMEHLMMKLRNLLRLLTKPKVSSLKQPSMLQFNSWLRKITPRKKRKSQRKKNGVSSCTFIMTANATTWRVVASKKAKVFTDKDKKMQPPSSLLTEKWLDPKVIKLLLNVAKEKHSWMETLELKRIQMSLFMLSITKIILFTMMSLNSLRTKWMRPKKNSASTRLMTAPSW